MWNNSISRPRWAFSLLAGCIALAACNEKSPTAPVVTPRVTVPTPRPSEPLGSVRVTLLPASSGFRHGFLVRIEVTETRGAGVTVSFADLQTTAPVSYVFPERISGIESIHIPPGGTGSTGVLVEANEDVSCSAQLVISVRLVSDDEFSSTVKNTFDCTTGYWPL